MCGAKKHHPLIIEGHLEAQLIDPGEIWLKYLSISLLDFIKDLKAGLSITQVLEVFRKMGLPKRQGVKMLRLSLSMFTAANDGTQRLPPYQTERVFGLIFMINMVNQTAMESNPSSVAYGGGDAAKWLKRWLSQPHPAIGEMVPSDLMDTIRGQNLVIKLLSQVDQVTYT